jgi:hypothetical protein
MKCGQGGRLAYSVAQAQARLPASHEATVL